MRKKLCFPATNRVHLARQQRLLDELRKDFDVDVFEPVTKQDGGMSAYAILCAVEFNNFLAQKEYDAVLIRADRFELLPIAAMCAYKGIPVVHIEGGCESGSKVVDSKVRHAITELADLHLVTDSQAQRKVIYLGADPDKVFNVGSLDVSFAGLVPSTESTGEYVLVLQHSIPGEDAETVYEAVKGLGYKVVGIQANADYQASLMQEEYPPEQFVNLMRNALCMVGNSSAICKEASILGTPCVLVGTRQDGRIVGRNVMRVPHEKGEVQRATKYQVEHGRYEPDEVYYQPDTESRVREILKTNL